MVRLPIEMVGQKIRTVRKEKGFTLEVLATRTGLSKGLLSQVERGISQPSLESLWRISKALESNFSYFFEEIDHNYVHIVRKEKRRQLVLPDSTGTYSLLSTGRNARIGMLEVKLQPGEETRDQLVQSEGEECLVVISGGIQVKMGEETFELNEGDSVYFDNAQSHVIANTGKEMAVLIWSVTPPQL